jgi:hypothetical protein
MTYTSPTLVIIDDFDVERIAFAELKANTPAVVDRHRPLLFPFAFQLVQPDASQRTEVLKTFSNIQRQHPAKRPLLRFVLLADDREGTADSVERLMGTKAEARFAFISERAEFASEDLLDV